MIEAMACGTPVIAWRCGSVPEVIEDGLTGFIVAIDAEAVDAVAPPARSWTARAIAPALRAALLGHRHGADAMCELYARLTAAREAAARASAADMRLAAMDDLAEPRRS